ncbi:MAG: M48 family metallopeptidase [Fimbriimonadaceae bacterium]|nr:M48 family metallopeptidase [Fimbriimonadaceae bacterium]
MARKRFPDISTDAFMADTDRQALEALKKIPFFEVVLRKFHEIGVDRALYVMNMGMSVRCGPKQFKTLHEILRESCEILDMPEPELYVTNNPFPNAWTGGVERPYITLRSSIVDAFTDEQLFDLIGHELGHIKAGHVLYMEMGRVLMQLLDLLGQYTFGVTSAASTGLVVAFFEWSRQAELTCDRAGLLTCQDFHVASDSLLRLTAGSTRFAGEMSVDAFLDQARMYQDMSLGDEIMKLLVFLAYGAWLTHPIPVQRMQELERWHLSGAYDKIMAGDYAKSPAKAARLP